MTTAPALLLDCRCAGGGAKLEYIPQYILEARL